MAQALVLDAMEKGLKVTDVVRARKALGRAGIRACYFLQFGYPGESWPEILQTIDLVRCTRPDEVGISVSYPLPNTRFYDRVQHQLGSKRNWLDSDDLCLTFTAAYTAEFYRAVRDALHAEVSAWSNAEIDTREEVAGLWQRAAALEGVSRNAEPTSLEAATPEPANLVSIGTLSLTAGER